MDYRGGHQAGASFSLPSSTMFVSYEFVLIHAPIPMHEIYYSSISVFLNLVILKFQGMNTTPFFTHHTTAYAAVISCLLLSYCSMLQLAGVRLAFLRHFVGLLWSLCVASLVSLLLSDVIRPVLYVLSTVPFVAALMHCVCLIIWRKFQDWLDFQRIWIFRHLCRDQRPIGTRIPV